MNKIFTTPRGFPFDAKTLQELQDLSLPPLEGLSNIMPSNCRLKGVVVNDSVDPTIVTDGIIIWNGEILPFIGGESNGQFSIMEEIEERPFNVGTDIDPDIEDHPAYKRRWAEVGTITGAVSTHTLASLRPLPRLMRSLRQGIVFLGNVVPGFSQQRGTVIPVTFPTLGTAEYVILTSFFRAGTTTQPSFETELYDKTATGFKLRLKNISAPMSVVFFEYILIPSANQFAAISS